MLEADPDVLTINDLMSILHLGRNSIYNLLKNDYIQSIKVGKKYIIPKKCVENFLEQKKI